ncbi:MAG: hypothetical protein IJ115_09100 [Erysipelotrichaceae bacterium]|nr:hypothetical protein [Erysipelotrichaceae bacterium]
MEYRSHKIRIFNIPSGKMVYQSTSKPVTFTIISLVLTLLVFLTEYKLLAIIMAVVVILFYLLSNKKQISGYDSFVIVYNQHNNEFCDIIYFSEINYWEYRITRNGNKVMLFLNDGEKYCVDNGVSMSTHAYFQKHLPEKELKSREERLSKGL